VPLIFGLGELYKWADPRTVAADPNLKVKAAYFYFPGATFDEESGGPLPWFFLVRAVLYFALWGGLTALLNAWSRKQDSARSKEITGRCETVSAPGLGLYVVTITFASVDWVMSLEPHWYSTIYGAMFGMGQVLSGYAFALAMLMLLSAQPPLDRPEVRQTQGDLGNLLLAFVMVWAYLSFCQFLLIWSGNLPEEVPWYQVRLEGPWKFVALALLLFQFAMPFVLLLSRDRKRDRWALARVAIMVVVMRSVELLWLIVPAFSHHGHGDDHDHGVSFVGVVLYPAALVGVGGLWLSYYLRQVRRWPLLPEYNPEEAGEHGQGALH
jgi:hypothetical protein